MTRGMTRDDNLFDIKYVKFDADGAQGLIGKDVFVSDSLYYIREAVDGMYTTNPFYYGKLQSAQNYVGSVEAIFKIDCDERTFKYLYYDPYYELKCAFKRGETIEYKDIDDWEVIISPIFNDKPECYRIKPKKPALKWQDIKIGDILRGPYHSDKHNEDPTCYGMVTMVNTDSELNYHILIGNDWVRDTELCTLRRVNAVGEDIE